MRRALASLTVVVACVVCWGCGSESPTARTEAVDESPPAVERVASASLRGGAESEAALSYDMEEAFDAGEAAEPAYGSMSVGEGRARR